LATTELYKLVENTKANQALCGNLLPLNNNASILDVEGLNSLTVMHDDPSGAIPVAFGLFNMCTPSQGYCSIVSASNDYDNVFVNLEQVKTKAHDLGVSEESSDQHGVFKIKNVIQNLPDLGSFPQYYRAFREPIGRPLHQCVIDELIKRTVGEKNYDVKRNITVDLYDLNSDMPEHSDELWRDFSGFVVADKHRLAEFEIETPKLVSLLKNALAKQESTPLKFQSLNQKSSALFIDYDQSLSLMDRQTYLEYLFSIHGVSGTVALDAEEQPVGYVISLNDRILQCYAETAEIGQQLMIQQLSSSNSPITKLFTAAHDRELFEVLTKNSKTVRRVRRFHSRTVPPSVKWSQMFAFNVGVNLF